LTGIVIRATRPRSFNFEIGGFFGGCQSLKLQEGHLIYTSFTGPVGNSLNDDIEPSDEQWVCFRNELIALGAFKWDKDYYNHDICDGTQWELRLKWGRQHIHSSGSNEYPRKFSAFLTSLKRLTGVTFLR
jgi:hypothetical protein